MPLSSLLLYVDSRETRKTRPWCLTTKSVITSTTFWGSVTSTTVGSKRSVRLRKQNIPMHPKPFISIHQKRSLTFFLWWKYLRSVYLYFWSRLKSSEKQIFKKFFSTFSIIFSDISDINSIRLIVMRVNRTLCCIINTCNLLWKQNYLLGI